MKNKFLKACIIVSISASVFFCCWGIAKACASGDFDYEIAGYSLFSQELIGRTPMSPFLFDPSQPYYQGLLDSSTAKTFSGNEAEWVAYMAKGPSEKDIYYLMSKSRLIDLEELKKAVLKQTNHLSDTMQRNSGAKYLILKGDLESCNYLIFAKRCEPHANAGGGEWGNLPVRDTLAMEKLVNEGKQYAKSQKNLFLRNRYAFQAARMAHYRGDYTTCLELCSLYESAVPADSYISRRFQALMAGALKHAGQFEEARYRFAMLFDKYYDEDFDFYYKNFAFSTPAYWNSEPRISANEALPKYSDSLGGYQFCRNAHEKAVLHFLDAYSGTSLEIPAMKTMFKLEPGSELIDILLVRTLTEMEKSGYFAKHMYDYSGVTSDKPQPGDRDPKAFRAFVQDCLTKGKLKRKYLWEYVAGHLSYMMKDYTTAHQYFNTAIADAPSGLAIAKQARGMELLMEVELAKHLDADFEAREMAGIKWMKENYPKDDRLSYLFWRMAQRYDKQGDTIKALMCYSQSARGIDLITKAETHPLAKLINWITRPGKSPFEEQLVLGFKYALGQLHELQGTVFLRQHRLTEARDEFQMAGNGNLLPLPGDPFEIHIRDCHDCDFAEAHAHPYSKLTFVQRMIDLEKQSDEPGPDQASAAFDAANGYYNMSYYGNSWMTLAYQRSGYDTTEQYYDCSVALYFYDKARKLSSDAEFQAKCAYMASKCQHNDGGPQATADEKRAQDYHIYDQMLKDQFSKTSYYKEVIGECSYFRYFSNH